MIEERREVLLFIILICLLFGWAVDRPAIDSVESPSGMYLKGTWIPFSSGGATQGSTTTNSAELIKQVNSAMRQPRKTQEIDDVSETDFVNPSSPSDKPAKPEILIFVSKTCPPCEKWKRCEMQRFLDAGWSVGIIEVHRYPITPRYEINANGKQVDHVGYITFEQAKELAK